MTEYFVNFIEYYSLYIIVKIKRGYEFKIYNFTTILIDNFVWTTFLDIIDALLCMNETLELMYIMLKLK